LLLVDLIVPDQFLRIRTEEEDDCENGIASRLEKLRLA
jgi:hypothetical protein